MLTQKPKTKERFKMYNGEIIHFAGGINDYIGKLDQTEHPAGKGWHRILNPCLHFMAKDPSSKKMQNIIVNMAAGPTAENNYRKFVDIYIPPDSIIEVRILDQKGDLCEAYRKESERRGSSLIKSPGSDVVTAH